VQAESSPLDSQHSGEDANIFWLCWRVWGQTYIFSLGRVGQEPLRRPFQEWHGQSGSVGMAAELGVHLGLLLRVTQLRKHLHQALTLTLTSLLSPPQAHNLPQPLTTPTLPASHNHPKPSHDHATEKPNPRRIQELCTAFCKSQTMHQRSLQPVNSNL
jgi:hypothetical protein